MKIFSTVVLISALASGGFGLVAPVAVADHGKQSMHMMHGKGHGGHHDRCWKATLSDEQKSKVAKLKLDFKKKKLPIKSRLRQAKVDLALLIISDSPDQNEIGKKIDEIAKLKAEKMRLKADFKIKLRNELNDEQRVLFDTKMLKKAYHGKKKGGHRKGHH